LRFVQTNDHEPYGKHTLIGNSILVKVSTLFHDPPISFFYETDAESEIEVDTWQVSPVFPAPSRVPESSRHSWIKRNVWNKQKINIVLVIWPIIYANSLWFTKKTMKTEYCELKHELLPVHFLLCRFEEYKTCLQSTFDRTATA
jgi:hypothetical protein